MSRPDPSLFNRKIGDELDWLATLLDRARRHAGHLSDREIGFVDEMTLRVDKWAAETFVSDRQRSWLKSIDRRLDEAGVPGDRDDPGDPVARLTDEGWG